MKLIPGRKVVWKASAQRLKVSAVNWHRKIELLNRNSLTVIFQIYIPMKNEGKKHSVPGRAQVSIPVENWREREPLVNSATSLRVWAWGRTGPAIALAVLIWWILGTFMTFHVYRWTTPPSSAYLAYLKEKVPFFSHLQIGDSRTGVLRSEPSEVFWILIQRRVKNSNARKGCLGRTSTQTPRTHSVTANHTGSPEPRARASTPRDAWLPNSVYFLAE